MIQLLIACSKLFGKYQLPLLEFRIIIKDPRLQILINKALTCCFFLTEKNKNSQKFHILV